jgi:two-component system sensor histidine kinase AgrC
MNTIQKIMNILMNPNAELINIISIPCTLIEIIIYVNMCLVLLNIKTDRKHKYLCICFIFFISMIFKLFISAPYNIICNTLIFVLAFLLFFKTSILGGFIGFAIPFILTALLEMISSQIYTLIFNKPYAEFASYPLYSIIFLLIVYTCLFIMYPFFKHFKVNISLFTHLNKKDYISILGTVILGFITVFLQLYITAFYNNILPHSVILLSIACLIAYFFVSLFNIIKTKQLEIANRDINNLQLYNNTLKIMYDNIRAFKHDFHNIMNSIGRICNS